jgi:alpha-1,3-fucosyltransferase
MASWLVSNCKSYHSNRTALVRKLESLGIKVEIIGECGNNTLKFYDRFNEAIKAKFYFAFENSLCTDYITEKAYKMHNQDIIPVIYSGGKFHSAWGCA